MTGETFLRSYRSDDLESLYGLDVACFAEEFRFDRGSMSAFAGDPDAVALIAEDGGEVIGFVIAHVKRVSVEWRAYVVTLDVAPRWRRKGLASELMEEVETR